MGLFRRSRPSYSDTVTETVVAADVKARAETILDQMTTNLTDLRILILGREGDVGRGPHPPVPPR